MCYATKCGTCGKSTWAGCGRHVASVYSQISQGQHCLCRGWPGVKLPGEAESAARDGGSSLTAEGAAADAKPSMCTIS